MNKQIQLSEQFKDIALYSAQVTDDEILSINISIFNMKSYKEDPEAVQQFFKDKINETYESTNN